MLKSAIVATAAILAALAFPASAQTDSHPSASAAQSKVDASASLTKADRTFLDQAAEDTQGEIQLCLLAEKLAQSPAVKAFARLMVVDHMQVESQLASLINRLNVTVPNGPGERGKQTMDRLQTMQGPTFDRSFMEAQVKDHADDVGRFQREVDSADNREIGDFASQSVGVLKQHLELATLVLAGLTGQSSESMNQSVK